MAVEQNEQRAEAARLDLSGCMSILSTCVNHFGFDRQVRCCNSTLPSERWFDPNFTATVHLDDPAAFDCMGTLLNHCSQQQGKHVAYTKIDRLWPSTTVDRTRPRLAYCKRQMFLATDLRHTANPVGRPYSLIEPSIEFLQAS
jgi:hypothetical protein